MTSHFRASMLLYVVSFLSKSNSLIMGGYRPVIIDAENKSTYSLEPTAHLNPSILVSIKIGNNSHSLPTFLKTMESIKCENEKKKCDLWVVFDKSTDQSFEIFNYWLENTRILFDTVTIVNRTNDRETKTEHVSI